MLHSPKGVKQKPKTNNPGALTKTNQATVIGILTPTKQKSRGVSSFLPFFLGN